MIAYIEVGEATIRADLIESWCAWTYDVSTHDGTVIRSTTKGTEVTLVTGRTHETPEPRDEFELRLRKVLADSVDDLDDFEVLRLPGFPNAFT